ncbi:MAG: radical SAM protein [Theionarchaea archaeon]|nr:radical SAM protein [Theionarchaea archaeon]
MINEEEYPVTSGNVIIKKVRDFYRIIDVKTGTAGKANQDLRDLFVLCDGTRTVREILEELSKNYREPRPKVKEKVIKSIEFLEGLNFLSLNHTPQYTPLVIRESDMEWPLDIVYLEVTNTCNLDCIHCYKHAGPPLHNELSTDEWCSIIDHLKEIGVVELAVTGGEPLMRDDIFSILEHAARNAMWLKLFTNGTLINEETVQKLKEIGVEEIMVSIEGATKETHELIRGKDTFEKVIKSISLLIENGMKVRSNTVLYTENIPELENLVQLLLDLKVQDMILDPLMKWGRGEDKDNLIPPMEIGKKVAELLKKSEIEGKKIFELKFTSDIQNQDPNFSFCGIGTSMCAITANGNVCLCPALYGPEFTAGNVKDASVRELWLESKIFQPFRTCKTDDMQCKTCPSKLDCRGGCKARVLQYYGKVCMPDPWMCVTQGQKWPLPTTVSTEGLH